LVQSPVGGEDREGSKVLLVLLLQKAQSLKNSKKSCWEVLQLFFQVINALSVETRRDVGMVTSLQVVHKARPPSEAGYNRHIALP
jgi:hypothetical protein